MCDSLVITDYNNLSTEMCFKLRVWSMQRKYSVLVDKYLKMMQYGTFCKGQHEDLKMFRRLLLVLNRYDIRDIPSDTMTYNVISYDTVREILNTLSNKY